METEVISDVEDTSKPKKIVERSASYPGISIEDAYQFVLDIQKHFPGSRIFTRDDAVAVLKTKALNRDIAAAKEFGFLIKTKDGFQVSDLFKTISNHLSEREKRKCLLEAFGSPKLYREIISKYDGHALPNEFKIHLIRFFRIVEKAAQFAADLFIANARYVGAINEHGILNYKEAIAKVSNANLEYAEIITEDNNENDGEVVARNGSQFQYEEEKEKKQDGIIIHENKPTEEKIKVPLTEKKFAFIVYPSNINLKDIEILKKQIELLELLVT